MKDKLVRLSANGVAGNDELLQIYHSATDSEKNVIVAALGDAPGNLGIQLIRGVLRDRSAPSNTRCAAMVALTRRLGADASDVLQECLREDDASLRRYAVHGLAVAGDGAAWPQVLDILQDDIAEQSPFPPFGMQWDTLSLQSTVLQAVCYLGRHLGVSGRRERVTTLVRSRWNHLYTAEQRWFDEFWPQCNPEHEIGRSAHPDPRMLSEWAARPLFLELPPVG